MNNRLHRTLLLTALLTSFLLPNVALGQVNSVLVWGTGISQSSADNVAAMLLQQSGGVFTTIDTAVDGGQTLANLSNYDAVLFFTDGAQGSDPNNGDVLADYADTGARLVLCTFSWADQVNNTLGGRIVSDALSPFAVAGGSLYANVSMASNDGSVYFTGVATLTGHYHDNVALTVGAVSHGVWSDGSPLVASKANVVGVNLYPDDSADEAPSGDYQQLFVNALSGGTCPDSDGDGDSDVSCGGGDCDDTNAAVNSGAVEICNGLDDNCDGVLLDAVGEVDVDMDTVLSCNDCDDDDDGNFPGNTELCDGQDNDCNGLADFNDGPVGDDDDSAGPSMDSTELDIDGDGYLECDDDCDDDSVDFAPDAPELCDGFDNNCDGLVPGDEADTDADTWLECAGDCDDTNADANPDAPEASADACTDGFDNDCDGDTDEDDSDCDGLLGDDDDSAGDDDARARLGHCNCSAASSAGNVGAGLLLLGLLGLVRRRQL